jgi:hypothetical protein
LRGESIGAVDADPNVRRSGEGFANARDVTRETRNGFGSGALKVRDKIFAMMTPAGSFVVKLPKVRVDDLVADGVGARFEPGPGES